MSLSLTRGVPNATRTRKGKGSREFRISFRLAIPDAFDRAASAHKFKNPVDFICRWLLCGVDVQQTFCPERSHCAGGLATGQGNSKKIQRQRN